MDEIPFARADCAALATFDVIAHRWSALVVYALSRGLNRPRELRRDIPGLSQKILTETLRRLERDGPGRGHRVEHDENPPRASSTR